VKSVYLRGAGLAHILLYIHRRSTGVAPELLGFNLACIKRLLQKCNRVVKNPTLPNELWLGQFCISKGRSSLFHDGDVFFDIGARGLIKRRPAAGVEFQKNHERDMGCVAEIVIL